MQGHAIPHWEVLRYGKDDLRGLSCDSTHNIYQNILKSGNFLHKSGFVDSQSSSILNEGSQQIWCDVIYEWPQAQARMRMWSAVVMGLKHDLPAEPFGPGQLLFPALMW